MKKRCVGTARQGTVKAFMNAAQYTDQNLNPSNVPAGSLVIGGQFIDLGG